MNIIGISALYHTSACCLINDGQVVAAAAEERFTRVKHDSRLPTNAFRYCLEAGRLSIDDIDCVAWYESPSLKAERQLWALGNGGDRSEAVHHKAEDQIKNQICILLGFEGPIQFFQHHLSHAASAFYYSGFQTAAILIVDGVGEWATTTFGRGKGSLIDIFEEVSFPHSLGLFYSTLTAYLGFKVNDGEYKVMGLAPYGTLRYVDHLKRMIHILPSGQYRMSLKYFDFLKGKSMYSPMLPALLGQPARRPGAALTAFHCDVARSLQHVFEEILLAKANYLATRMNSPNLCLAGGAALNCVANGKLLDSTPFKTLFVQPAAGDDGACLGAAMLAYLKLAGPAARPTPLKHMFLGPRWTNRRIKRILRVSGLAYQDYRGQDAALLEEVAGRLAAKQVVGWFQGAMEFGPRALGNRSILANPMDPDIQRRLNQAVKKRESFRPFAPSVLLKEAPSYFDLLHPAPHMLETCRVKAPFDFPGITHVDGSARPQTVTYESNGLFYRLIEKFSHITGCPLLVNTSFNLQDQPIVRSPTDALLCMVETGLDCLVLESFLIDKAGIPDGLAQLVSEDRLSGSGPTGVQPMQPHNLYSFTLG